MRTIRRSLCFILLVAAFALLTAELIRRPREAPTPIISTDRQPALPRAAVVIQHLREVSQLVTLTVEAGPWEERIRQRTTIKYWPDATETVSALVAGRITYGLDLSQLSTDDVHISSDGRHIRIRLPPTRKLSAQVDLDRCRILNHERSWHWSRDPTLREAVLTQAQQRLRTLDPPRLRQQAQRHAEQVVSELVRQLCGEGAGVEFVTSEPASDASRRRASP